MRLRKSFTIKGRPSWREILGSQPSNSLARVMSGFLLCGSSSVLGRNSIFASESIVSWTTLASSSIVNSPGFPRLNGPTWSPSISRINPCTCVHLYLSNYFDDSRRVDFSRNKICINAEKFTRSETYWKLLVCFPLP